MKKIKLLSIFIVTFLLTGMVVTAGSGKGNNNNEPLTIESSNVENNQKGFPIDGEIKLVFSKNVVNASVNEKNNQLISLFDESDNKVAIDIIMADDQIDPEKKRDVIIKPLSPLNKNTKYKLIIDKEFSSKSGAILLENNIIEFTTKGSNALLITVIICIALLIVCGLIWRKKKA